MIEVLIDCMRVWLIVRFIDLLNSCVDFFLFFVVFFWILLNIIVVLYSEYVRIVRKLIIVVGEILKLVSVYMFIVMMSMLSRLMMVVVDIFQVWKQMVRIRNVSVRKIVSFQRDCLVMFLFQVGLMNDEVMVDVLMLYVLVRVLVICWVFLVFIWLVWMWMFWLFMMMILVVVLGMMDCMVVVVVFCLMVLGVCIVNCELFVNLMENWMGWKSGIRVELMIRMIVMMNYRWCLLMNGKEVFFEYRLLLNLFMEGIRCFFYFWCCFVFCL